MHGLLTKEQLEKEVALVMLVMYDLTFSSDFVDGIKSGGKFKPDCLFPQRCLACQHGDHHDHDIMIYIFMMTTIRPSYLCLPTWWWWWRWLRDYNRENCGDSGITKVFIIVIRWWRTSVKWGWSTWSTVVPTMPPLTLPIFLMSMMRMMIYA